MKTRIEVAFLGLLAAVFTLVAALACFAPHLLFEPIGLSLDSSAVAAELRAAYTGLFGLAAWIFARGALLEERRGLALSAAAIVLGGFTLGRLVSLGLDGAPDNALAVTNLVLESLGFCAALVLVLLRRRGA